MKEKEEKPRESRIQKREMKSFEIESREDKREYIWKAKEYRKGKVNRCLKEISLLQLLFCNLLLFPIHFWNYRIEKIRKKKRENTKEKREETREMKNKGMKE